MNLDMEAVRLGVQAINLIAVVWLAMSARDKVSKDSLDTKLATHADRLTALETNQKNGPTHADLNRIHERLDKIGENFSSLSGELKGKGHTLDLIHEYLLKEGRK